VLQEIIAKSKVSRRVSSSSGYILLWGPKYRWQRR
jgi:hypothetical protein